LTALDYIDIDLAYFLGAIVARGEITKGSRMTTIVIHYPFKNLEAEGLTKSYDVPSQLALGLDPIVSRIRTLGYDADKKILQSECQIVVNVRTESVGARILSAHLGRASSYREFHVPEAIFNADKAIQKEFIRGYVDVAGHVRKSNYYIDGRHRVYIDVLNMNWHLPVELCTLLQDHLGVPVQTIDWGHPNMRDPNLTDWNAGRQRAWAREHQIKVFADAFRSIGFYISYKDEILNELAEYNESNYPDVFPKFCSPPPSRPPKPKPIHPAENDSSLPPQLRGRHFNAYWEICEAMGCPRCRQQRRLHEYV